MLCPERAAVSTMGALCDHISPAVENALIANGSTYAAAQFFACRPSV